MAVRVEERRGMRRLIIDIRYRRPDGSRGRFRRDAEVQSLTAARAEDRRRLAALAMTGLPDIAVIDNTPVSQPVSQPPGEPPTPESTITFKATVEAYLSEFAPSQLKPSTQTGYKKILDGMLLPEFGDQPLSAIDTRMVRSFDVQLVKRGLKPSTRRNVHIVLRSVLCRFAVEAGLLEAAPRFPKLPKCGDQITGVPTLEDVEQLIAAAPARAQLAFMLSAFAGLRAGEVRGLRWLDVDLRRNHLVVRRSISHGIASAPKSGHERVVPLVPRLQAVLKRGRRGGPSAPASPSSRNRPWGQFALGKAFAAARKKAKVNGWRYHDLRHYFVTSLFRAGVPAPVVQQLAGHKHLRTTQRYTHVTADELGAGINALVEHHEGQR